MPSVTFHIKLHRGMVKSMIEKMLIIKLKKGNVNLMRVRGVSIQRTQVENEHVVLLNSEYFT